MSTNENLNHQEHHHMTKEQVLEYLLSKMTEENGVYKTVVNRKDIENNPNKQDTTATIAIIQLVINIINNVPKNIVILLTNVAKLLFKF